MASGPITISRWRAYVGLLAGTLTLALGTALRFVPAAEAPGRPRIEGPVLAAAALSVSIALGAALFARPRRDVLWLLGLVPLAGALGPVMLLLGAIARSKAGDLLVSAGVQASGGAALLLAAVHLVQARAMRSIPRFLFDLNRKVHLSRPGTKKLEVPVEALVEGDEIELAPGEDVPVDGTIASGSGFVDESLLSGEKLPAAKQPGDAVWAGSNSAIPELVVRVKRPLQDSLLAQREQLTEAVKDDLLYAGRAGRIGIAAAIGIAIIGLLAIALRSKGGEVELWLPEIAGLLLACVSGGPALARIRGRLETLRVARGMGLVFARAKDVHAFGSVRRWQVDPELLAAPGEVEVLALGGDSAEALLTVAEALLSNDPGPERASLALAARRKNIAPRSGAALRRSRGVFHGTVTGTRWSMGPERALEEEMGLRLDPRMAASIDFLRDRGLITWLVVKSDEEIVGAIGIGIAADEDSKRAAERLGATVMPGLPDTTRKAVAAAAGITCDGPPLKKRDATLLAEGSPNPSTGMRIRVLASSGSVELRSDGSPRLLGSAVSRLPELVDLAKGLRRRARTRAVLLALVPAIAALFALFVGVLSPLTGALFGLASLLATRVSQPGLSG